ncbi:MAG TPA: ribose-5-phosphate isomerase RpiA [Thermomicrobiales bacterium]|nr:ribose-5-phosphate isomerase RpiA [Thermomicrobiales bacterium]
MDTNTRLERIGAQAAGEVQPGMIVGLGTGSTASAFVRALGARVAEGLSITGVPTSTETERLARSLNIPLTELNRVDVIDLCIDGADEIDPALNVVKGRGGALLFEKLVARRTDRYIIIAADDKLVNRLGTRLPLPVEIVPMGWQHTARELERIGLGPVLRTGTDGNSFVTDSGHYIVDCETGGIEDAPALASKIKAITGVVDHGLLIGLVDLAMTIDATGRITTHESAIA